MERGVKLLVYTILVFTFISVYVHAAGYVTLNTHSGGTANGDNSNSTSSNVFFNCTATPDPNWTVVNTTLLVYNSTGLYYTHTDITDNATQYINTSITTIFNTSLVDVVEYGYNWTCKACMNQTNGTTITNVSVYNVSTNYSLGVDTTEPDVYLKSPAHESGHYNGSVNFIYEVNDTSTGISNCSLYLNSSLDQTNLSVIEATNQEFSVSNITEADALEWYVTCRDNHGLAGTSSTWQVDTRNNTVEDDDDDDDDDGGSSSESNEGGSSPSPSSSDDDDEDENETIEATLVNQTGDTPAEEAEVMGEGLFNLDFLGNLFTGAFSADHLSGTFTKIRSNLSFTNILFIALTIIIQAVLCFFVLHKYHKVPPEERRKGRSIRFIIE